MTMRSILFAIFIFLTVCTTSAKEVGHTLTGYIFERQQDSLSPLPFAAVQLTSVAGYSEGAASDIEGKYKISSIPSGIYRITVSYIGKKEIRKEIRISSDTSLDFTMEDAEDILNEVVVTARESKGMTSASKIDITAMEHLQPTSFTDLLSLLPGGSTYNPRMTSANIITIREAGISSSDYETTSLGTQFVIDGTPVNTNANLQWIKSDMSDFSYKNSVNEGVDMRSIPTDNIQDVEIVRGIPSVEYGDLTSGLVLINRKDKATPLTMRIKADQYGKLFSIGKGLETRKQWTISSDAGFLSSKVDPRNNLENYKRITFSLRSDKSWNPAESYRLRLKSSFDYGGNIDNSKTDPDVLTMPEDNYRSSNTSLGLNNILSLTRSEEGFFRSIEANFSANMSFDKIKRSRFIGLDRDRIVPTNMTEGVYDAEILPYKYTAHMEVDGKPLNLYASLKAKFSAQHGWLRQNIVTGANWSYAKNFGMGQIYDMRRPLDPTYGMTRPRTYKSIPAYEVISLYVEDLLSASAGRHKIDLQIGLRTNSLANIDSRYSLHGKIYVDPRANIVWTLPGLQAGGKTIVADLGGGIGWLSKMPTLAHLYPDLLYLDIIQLNYWNQNKDFKRINVRSYILDPTNYGIKAARNFKWEVRGGLEYDGNRLSVTLFREDLKSGFRSAAIYRPFIYDNYDESAIHGNELTGPPQLSDVPSVRDTVLRGYSQYTNGSRTLKEGVEFQFSSKRFKKINTRLTVNGAWFRTTYSNSQPVYNALSYVIGNTALSDKYIGLYKYDDGYVRQQFNTNFIVDTYLPKLGMKISATAECTWFYKAQTKRHEGVPIGYIDVSGQTKPFPSETDSELYRKYLSNLIVDYSDIMWRMKTTPFFMYVNLKLTKDFTRYIGLSLFVDRLIDIVPDYTQYGVQVRRTPASPYFGMELNIRI